MSVATDPHALLQQAALHESAGRLGEAIAAYEQLLRHWPDLPNSWYNLGRLCRRAGRFDAALAAYRQALDRGISEPEEVHLNRAVVYSDGLRDPDAAERELTTALRLNPVYLPALQNLANLHEDRGSRDAALTAYERLLALCPTAHEGLARYASLRGTSGPADPLLARLREAIARPDTRLQARASLGFALGKLLDGCGEYDAAFAAYAAANAHSRAGAGAVGPLYDRRAQEALVDRLIAAFPRPAPTPASGGTAPIFICGMFRSGSTLVEQVLAAHPGVFAGGEIDFIPQLVRTRLAPYPETVAGLSPAERAAIATEYRNHLTRIGGAARRVTDKRPDNFLHIGLIKTLFPNAKIVHTTRQPLDNALSIYFLHLAPSMGYAFDLGDIGHYTRQHQRLMAHWTALYRDDIFELDYDRFVREPRPLLDRLLAFCGLDWNAACLDFHRNDNSVRTASVWQVRQPLYPHASGRWRHYERHLAPLLEVLGDGAGETQPP